MLPSQEQRARAGRSPSASSEPNTARVGVARSRGRRKARRRGGGLRGLIAIVRRAVLPAVGRLTAAGALVLLVLWAAGLILNDRSVWSQFLWWIPTGLVCLIAWTGLGVSKLCETAGTRVAGVRARPIVLAGAVFATLWLAAVDLRLHRGLGGTEVALAENETPLRIAYWNAAWSRPADVTDTLDQLNTDILIVANPRPGEATRTLHAWMRRVAIAWDEADNDRAQTHLVRLRQMTLISRWPITASDVAAFGTQGSDGTSVSRATQTGIAAVSIDPGDAAPANSPADTETSPLTIWIVDLPSTPWISRVWIMDRAETLASRFDEAVSPPDIIIGDFNAPRGSASLAALTGDMTGVDAAIGWGRTATWPAPFPQLPIDLAFVAGHITPRKLSFVTFPDALHRAIVADLAVTPISTRRPAGDTQTDSEPAEASNREISGTD
ncbi:MAG: endonuclease/exonuclease/phosphatase family protein [Planctomycetota bacterium]